MTRVKSANPTDLPPPYSGFIDRYPISAIESPFCERMVNMNSAAGMVSYRHGDLEYLNNLSVANQSCIGIVVATDKKLYLIAYESTGPNTIVSDVSDFNSPSAASSVFVPQPAGVQTQAIGTNFANYTFIFIITTGGVGNMFSISPASVYAISPYTFSDVTFQPIQGASHKNRLYMIGRTDFRVAYSGIDAIAGPATVIDFKGVFTRGGGLVAVKSVAISDTIAAESFLVLISSNGEIVAYSGSYPESPDWRIVGTFQVSAPRNYNPVIDYQGDVLLMNTRGVVSIRDLFTKGSTIAANDSITANIPKRWRQLSTAFDVNYSGGPPSMGGIWDQNRNRLVCRFTNYVTNAGVPLNIGPVFLIYDIDTRSWTEHIGGALFSRAAIDISYYKDEVIYTCSQLPGVWIKEGKSDYLDDYLTGTTVTAKATASYPMDLISAPLPSAKLTQGLETLLQFISKSDMNSQIDIKLIGNLGAQIQGPSRLPNRGNGVIANQVSIGIIGNYVQYRLEFAGNPTSPAVGYELYAVSTLNSQGGIG